MDIQNGARSETENFFFGNESQGVDPSETDKFFSGQEESDRLRSAHDAALSIDPGKAQRVLKLEKETGLDPDLIDRNLEDVEKEQKKKAFDAPSVQSMFPTTATWYGKNPNHAAVVGKYLDSATKLERVFQDRGTLESIGQSVVKGLNSMNQSLAEAPALAYDVVALPQNLAVKALGRPDLQVRAPDWLRNNAVSQYYKEQSDMIELPELDLSVSDLVSKGEFLAAGRTMAVQAAGSVPNLMALFAANYLSGGTASLAMAGTLSASGSASEAADQGADPAMSTVNAVTQGTIEATAERLGTLGIFSKWEKAISRAHGKQAASEVMKDFAKTIAASIGIEGLEEGVTSIGQDASSVLTGVNPQGLEGAGQRAVDSFFLGGFMGLGMGGVGTTLATRARLQSVADAKRAKDFYSSMGANEEASELRKNLPDQHRELVENLTKDSPVENVYIPVEQFQSYFQSANENPTAIAQVLGVAESYNEAVETGGDIKVPLSTWTEKFIDTNHYRGLENDIKFSPEAMTYNQAQAARKEIQEEMAKAQEPQAESASEQAQDPVYDDVYNQLVSLGLPNVGDKEASVYATTVASFFNNMAARSGRSSEELYREYGLKITNGEMPSMPSINSQGYTPEFDENGKQVFEPSNLTALRRIISDGELIKSGAIPDESGAAVGYYSGASTFPDFFQNKGYTKKEALGILDKFESGKTLTEKQQSILSDLYDGMMEGMSRGSLYQDPIPLDPVRLQKQLESEAKAFFENPETREALKDEYRSKTETLRGRLLDADAARELWPEYRDNPDQRSILAGATDSAAGDLVREMYEELLAQPIDTGDVIIMGGGPGSGKSENLKKGLQELRNVDAVYDSVSANAEILEQRIEQALASGRNVTYGYVFTPIEKALNWIETRYHQTGRPVDAEYATYAHVFAQEAAIKMAEKYADDPRVSIQVYNNTIKTDDSRITVEELKELRYTSPNETPEEAVQRLLPMVKERLKDVESETQAAKQRAAEASSQARERARQNLQQEEYGRSQRGDGSSDPGSQSSEKTELNQSAVLAESGAIAPAFYSKLRQTVEQKMGGSADPAQIRGMLREVKPEEMKWSGIDQFLEGKTKVTKKELLDFLDENSLEIREITKSERTFAVGDSVTIKPDYREEFSYRAKPGRIAAEKYNKDLDSTDYIVEFPDGESEPFSAHEFESPGSTQYSKYVLPGGENYRELLFQLPENAPEITELPEDFWIEFQKKDTPFGEVEAYQVFDGNGEKVGSALNTKEASTRSALRALNEKRTQERADYTSSHFDEKNILAHTRLNDRVDADGKRVLFIEEIQSDWHQEGRKRGYTDASMPLPEGYWIQEDVEAKSNRYRWKVRDAQGMIAGLGATEKAAIENFQRVEQKAVPDAPFRKNWHEFVLKRLVRMAAEHGYDKIAWTTGEQQADRYNLAKRIDRIQYSPSKREPGKFNVIAYDLNGRDSIGSGMQYAQSEEQIEAMFGKEIAKKIVADEGSPTTDGSQEKALSGLQLSVGGEGMKGFYDKILVDAANKLFKKSDAKVSKADLPSEVSESRYSVVEEDGSFFVQDDVIGGAADGRGFESESDAESFKKTLDADTLIVHSLEITPALKEEALTQGFQLFQNQGHTPRGRITFGKDRQFTIDLFKHFDLSTFLHETGHFYMEVMGDLASQESAPQQIKDDYQTILDWMGVKSRDEIQVEHHEKWARGFESYLRDGKAPSDKLRQAFARIKIWLTQIYQRMTDLNVEITPEIRSVMDRMLSSQSEIEAAYGQQGTLPLFTDPKAVGMTDAQAERYMEARFEAQVAAEEILLAKLMEDHAREQRAIWKENWQRIEDKYESEANENPAYIALSILQKGTMPDGSALPEGSTAFKLSKEDLLNEVGKEGLKRLPRPYVYSQEGGIPLSMAAEMLGLESGDALFQALVSTPKKSDWVKSQTQAEMDQLFPDLLTSPLVKEEAIKAIHNDKLDELRRLELEHMASNNMPSLKDSIRKVARRIPTTQMVREEAERFIGQKKVGELQPHVYRLAEAKSAKLAGEALARGEFDASFEHKQKERLNAALFRAATEAKEQQAKAMKFFKKLNKADSKLAANRDIDYVNAARAVLARFGLGQAEKTATEYLEMTKKYDEQAYAAVMAIVNSATENAVPYKELKIDDFMALRESVEAIWDLAKSQRQMLIDGKVVERDKVEAQLFARLDEINKGKVKVLPGTLEAITDQEKRTISIRSLVNLATRVEHWAYAMDGGDPSGPFTKYVARPIFNATAEYRVKKVETLERLREIVRGIDFGDPNVKIAAPEIGYKFTKPELIMALLHTGNDSNLKKLLVGRGWGRVNEDGTLDRTRWDAMIYRMQKSGVLTKADYDAVQAIWDLNESLKPQAQKTFKRLNGHYFNEITANSFQTDFGEYRGGYMPAIADPSISMDADARSGQSLEDNPAHMFPTTGKGFTKSRVENYTTPLSLDFAKIQSHIDKVLRFSYIEPAVRDVHKIMNGREVRSEVKAVASDAVNELIVPWLKRASTQKAALPGLSQKFDRAMSFFRRSSSIQFMVVNIANAIQNTTGLFPSFSYVGGKQMAGSFKRYLSDRKGYAQSVMESSKYMQTRIGENAAEVQRDIDDMVTNPTKFKKFTDASISYGYFADRLTNSMVEVVVWGAGYNQAIQEGVDHQEAVQRADSIVRKGIAGMNTEDASRYEGGTPFVRLFTMFSSFFNTQMNVAKSEIEIARQEGFSSREGKKRLARTYTFVLAIPAILSAVIMRAMSGAGIDEDDDGDYFDDILDLFFMSQVKYAAALLPGGTVINTAFNQFNDKPYDDKINLSPALSNLEKALKAPKSVIDAADGGNIGNAVRDSFAAFGLVTGYPGGAVARPLGYAADVSDGRTEPSGPIDAVRGLVTGRGPK